MAKNDLLSYGSSAEPKIEDGGRHIVALSGGVASAWVAHWVKNNVEGEIIYYFNDTKWEHPDLYRFLDDLSKVLDINIFYDTDGRNPEQVFYDSKMLGSNRAPICSKVLKAERLQKFVKKHDTLYFGIDASEIRRAARIAPIYARFNCFCEFPLIEENVPKNVTFELMKNLGVEIPQMYKDGFAHNNCAGGCVRAGKKQWVRVLEMYPEIYAERERVEREFTKWNIKRRIEKDKKRLADGKEIKKPYEPREYHFIKDMSLKTLRNRHEAKQKQLELELQNEDDEWQGECVGICGRMY